MKMPHDFISLPKRKLKPLKRFYKIKIKEQASRIYYAHSPFSSVGIRKHFSFICIYTKRYLKMLRLQNQILKNSRIKIAVPLSLLIRMHHDVWQFWCFSEVENLHSASILFHHRERDQRIQTINSYFLPYECNSRTVRMLDSPCSVNAAAYSSLQLWGSRVNLHWELLPKDDVTWCAEVSASMCSVCMYLTEEGKDSERSY